MFCTNCGAENADGAKFCEKCGSPLNYKAPVKTPEKKEKSSFLKRMKDSYADSPRRDKIFIILIIIPFFFGFVEAAYATLGGHPNSASAYGMVICPIINSIYSLYYGLVYDRRFFGFFIIIAFISVVLWLVGGFISYLFFSFIMGVLF